MPAFNPKQLMLLNVVSMDIHKANEWQPAFLMRYVAHNSLVNKTVPKTVEKQWDRFQGMQAGKI